jgi:acetyl-CoA carboxylase biotin carboxyl carrier protein
MDDTPTEKLAALIAEFSRSGVRELHVKSGDFEVYLSNDPSLRITSAPQARTPPSAPASLLPDSRSASAARTEVKAPPSEPLPDDAFIVTAPNLGTFYRAPKPGAEDYVKVGSQVQAGDEVCLIEVMKLFTAVRSNVSGRIHSVLAEDGSMVEAGQPLFAVMRA